MNKAEYNILVDIIKSWKQLGKPSLDPIKFIEEELKKKQ